MDRLKRCSSRATTVATILGGGIKNIAGREIRRLEAKLETANLFPHIEHEDRSELDKRQRDIEFGQRLIDNYRSRKKSLGSLLTYDGPSPLAFRLCQVRWLNLHAHYFIDEPADQAMIANYAWRNGVTLDDILSNAPVKD